MAMPTIANTMWKARDTAIWERAASRSDMHYKLSCVGSGEWGVVPDGAIRVSAAHRRVPLPTPHAVASLPLFQRRGDDARLLGSVRGGVPLGGARALGPADVAYRDGRPHQLPQLRLPELPEAQD